MKKLNIHFTLDDEALSYCRSVNAAVRKVADSLIVFDEQSSMIPHATIAMGHFVGTNDKIEEFLVHIQRLVADVQLIQCSTGVPYLEDAANSYVLAEIDGGQHFRDVRRQFVEELSDRWLTNIGGSYGMETPHLTLAHVSHNQNILRQRLATIPHGPTFDCLAVEVSDVGRKGICANRLALFPVNRDSDRQ